LFFLFVCVCVGSAQTQPGSPARAPEAAAKLNTSGWIWSVPGDWICRQEVDCSGKAWPGTSIRFSSTVASDSNGRKSKDNGRRIVDHVDGVTPIYGYIRGPYAQGCRITKVGGGDVLIEQWEYGTDVWEEHWLKGNGQSFRVNLESPENAVQIFSNDFTIFAITISDCSLASYALDAGGPGSKLSK